MLLIQIILYSYIFHISNQYIFNFSDENDLSSELKKMTIDGVVYLTDFIIKQIKTNNTSKLNNSTSILQLYEYIWDNKSDLINRIKKLTKNCNFTNLNKAFNETKVITTKEENGIINYTESFKNFIINKSREYKIRWVINMENYLIKKDNITVKFGGIVDYVNFKSNEFLEEMILNSVKGNNISFDVFEEIIIGLRKEHGHIISYITSENSTNYLKQLYLRIYQFKVEQGGNDFIFSKINEYLNFEEIEKLTENLQDIIYHEILDLQDIQLFIDKIEYSGHRFINYNNELKNLSRDKLINYALYSESIHKIVFNETKSFSNLEEYVNIIPNYYLSIYINKTINEIPELNDFTRFKYIENREREDIIRNIFSLINTLSHDTILRMMINLYHIDKSNIINDDNFMDEIFFYSDSEIKDFFIEKINEYEYLRDFEMFLYKSEPNYIYNDMFYNYKKKFPEYILKEVLTSLNEYFYNCTLSLSNLLENINIMNKKELLSNIEIILNTRQELKDFNTFSDITNHIKGMNCYANFADFIIVHSNEELRRWVYKLHNYVKKKSKYLNVNYRLDIDIFSQQTCLEENDKDNIVNIIFLYQEFYPELRNYSNFINVIGKTKFQEKIEKLTTDEIRQYAYKLYQYYGIKTYKNKPYTKEFLNISFIDYISTTNDIDSLKLYINRVVVIYPELQIDGILKEVLNSNNINDTMNETDINLFLDKYNNDTESLEKILYFLLRYSNETNNKENFIPEYQNITNLKIEFKKVFLQNKFLHNNWNFARLLNENNDILYGGILPLLTRLNENQLIKIAKKYKKEINITEFSDSKTGKKIRILYDILNNKEIEKDELFNIIKFKKFESFDLSTVPKYKLIQYALICEYYVRKANKTNTYRSIYNNLYTINRIEIEDYINSTYKVIENIIKSVDDFNMYSNYLEFDKKEINTEIYSY